MQVRCSRYQTPGFIALSIAAALVVVGCREAPLEVEVDFTQRTPTTFAHHRATPLRVLVDRGAAPTSASSELGTLVHKLAAVLGRSADVVFEASSTEVARRLRAGQADLAVGRLAARAALSGGDARRVIAHSEARAGGARVVVVARAGIDEDERARWRTALVGLQEQPSALAMLARLSITRFVADGQPVAPRRSKP